jgi:hypothetical protein
MNMTVYQNAAGGGDFEKLEWFNAFRFAMKYKKGTDMHENIFDAEVDNIMAHFEAQVAKGLPSVPPFVPRAVFAAYSPAEKSMCKTSYATTVALVAYGKQEFPPGRQVRILFNQHSGRVGTTVVHPNGPVNPVYPGQIVADGAFQACISVLLEGDVVPTNFAMVDVALETDDRAY